MQRADFAEKRNSKYGRACFHCSIVFIVCVALILTSSVGASFAGEYEMQKSGDAALKSDGVTVIGDSVTLGAKLFAKLQKRIENTKGISWCSVDAKGSRDLAAGVKLARELRKKGKLGNIVVYSLTTNWHFGYKEAKRAFKAVGKGRYVIFVTGYVKGHTYPDQSNAAIRKLAKEEERVFIADWNKFIKKKKNKHLSDNYCHLNATSGRWYTNVVRAAVKEARLAHESKHKEKSSRKQKGKALVKERLGSAADTANIQVK